VRTLDVDAASCVRGIRIAIARSPALSLMTHPLIPPYAIRAAGAQRVEVACESPLQFEAKGWQRAMRADVRAAVARLSAGPNEVVAGVYAGPTGSWRVDAENVLFYNVGSGAFAASASHGLRFERLFGAAHAIGTDARYAHAATYETAAIGSEFRYCRRADTLASWDAVPFAGPPSASGVWAAMRDALDRGTAVRIDRAGLYGGPILLLLRVSSPAAMTNAASIAKPLIDGVIAAFTVHDGVDLAGVSKRIAEALGRPPDGVARALSSPPAMLFGTQRLVVCRSRGVQWLPPDDRLIACELVVDSRPGETWALSGSISVAQPVSAARRPGGATPV
jgi:hypothetical protein